MKLLSNIAVKFQCYRTSTEIVITADAAQTINGSPVVPFVLNGGFDGAEVSLAKAFRAELGDAAWVGKLEQFSGRVSDVQSGGRLQVSVTVRSVLELFNLPLPPSVYQPQCLNTVFDENCGLLRTSYENAGTVSVASGALRLTFGHTLPLPAGHFDLGAVEFISGANAGVRRTVRVHTASQVTVLQPWPNVVSVGDGFVIYRGCDLTMATCRDRYNNLSHFRGHPFVPPPEIVT